MANQPLPRAHEDIDKLIELIHSTIERTHATTERASSQGTKILATAHAGLGAILAAWLQRIFESSGTHLAALACYLAAALFPVMLGLLSVGVVCFVDIKCAQCMTDAVTKALGQLVCAKGWTGPPSKDELEYGQALGKEVEKFEQAARRWNNGSLWASAIGWGLLAAAFAILAVGVLVMV